MTICAWTELFGKVYRIVTKWYGNPRVFRAYRTGWFGEQVFYADDPAEVDVATPARSTDQVEAEQGGSVETAENGVPFRAAGDHALVSQGERAEGTGPGSNLLWRPGKRAKELSRQVALVRAM
ncbi:MAG: hypothetical protein BroJett024_40090 [Alphaproteobacteria bacterium]|nr:MAG: hypothetical protein BroJett024_40090 [Alphaproteobacteria bacterium]